MENASERLSPLRTKVGKADTDFQQMPAFPPFPTNASGDNFMAALSSIHEAVATSMTIVSGKVDTLAASTATKHDLNAVNDKINCVTDQIETMKSSVATFLQRVNNNVSELKERVTNLEEAEHKSARDDSDVKPGRCRKTADCFHRFS